MKKTWMQISLTNGATFTKDLPNGHVPTEFLDGFSRAINMLKPDQEYVIHIQVNSAK